MAMLDLTETQDDVDAINHRDKRHTTVEWVMKCLDLNEKSNITKREFIRCYKGDSNMYEFLAFRSVLKPNFSDGDLHGKEKYKIVIETDAEGMKLALSKGTGIIASVY